MLLLGILAGILAVTCCRHKVVGGEEAMLDMVIIVSVMLVVVFLVVFCSCDSHGSWPWWWLLAAFH